jgi:hypothetical protein
MIGKLYQDWTAAERAISNLGRYTYIAELDAVILNELLKEL